MEVSISTILTFSIEECCACGIRFGIPSQIQLNLRESHKSFYCPNGHSQSYTGESQSEKLQRELKRKELANVVRDKLNAQSEVATLNKKLKRVHNGTCPCCKRSFANLKAHIKTKHPELLKPV